MDFGAVAILYAVQPLTRVHSCAAVKSGKGPTDTRNVALRVGVTGLLTVVVTKYCCSMIVHPFNCES
mgnify:CR=1 FL=1